nr:MAG TPA: hypothetical protein [Caudoviricetes sp.]
MSDILLLGINSICDSSFVKIMDYAFLLKGCKKFENT